MAIIALSEFELQLLSRHRLIAGVDEVGRGALAGPVVAAAIILPPHLLGNCTLPIRDSKKLTPSKRAELFYILLDVAVACGCAAVPPQVIDLVGISTATKQAMQRAVLALHPQPDYVLADGFPLPELQIPNTGVVHGDDLCISIAAASIVAKVIRDDIMDHYGHRYPHYGFGHHKGYGTKSHVEALTRWGPSPIHRRSFAPVSACSYELNAQAVR